MVMIIGVNAAGVAGVANPQCSSGVDAHGDDSSDDNDNDNEDVDVDVEKLWAQADASMPISSILLLSNTITN